MKILNVEQGRQNMSSLQGTVNVDFDTLVEIFGAPHYETPSGDEKVNTEWELRFEVEEFGDVETLYATIYDWKDYDGGQRSRNSVSYDWHIGGFNPRAVHAVRSAIEARTGV
jgi:hypothetical protein